MPNPESFFWIAAFIADAAAVNPSGITILLATYVSRFSINSKSAVINGLWKLRNSPLWQLIFLVVSFDKTPLFSKS